MTDGFITSGKKKPGKKKTIEKEIGDFIKEFTKKENKINFLYFFNNLEEKLWRIHDRKDTKKSFSSLVGVAKLFCYKNNVAHKLNFEHTDSILNNYSTVWDAFNAIWDINQKSRDCSAIILQDNNKKVLFVVTTENVLNFPMGKIDFLDNKSAKTTGLRELGEEVGFWWHPDKVENIHLYTTIKTSYIYNLKKNKNTTQIKTEKKFTYFIYNDFDESSVLRYKSPNSHKEIKKIVWVEASYLKKYFNENYVKDSKIANEITIEGEVLKVAKSIKLFFDDNSSLKKFILDSNTNINLNDISSNKNKATEHYKTLYNKISESVNCKNSLQ